MDKLKSGPVLIFAIILLLAGSGILMTGALTGKTLLTAIGGSVMIIAFAYFMVLACILILSQRKFQRELFNKVSSIEKRTKLIENASLKTRDYVEKDLRAMISVYSYLDDLNAPLPLMQGYSLEAEAGQALINAILERRPDQILDIGSGASGILAGYTTRKIGHGHVWSVEHDPEYYEKSLRMLKLHGLSDRITLLLAPLKSYKIGGEDWLWYDLDVFPAETTFDFVMVDGPPGKNQKMARYPALPLLKELLGPDPVILLDDYNRADEQATIDRWLQEFPGMKLKSVATRKGLAILT